MNLEKTLEKLKSHAEEALEAIVKKDNITAAELETAEKAVCTLNTINMITNGDNNGYSGNMSNRMYDPMYADSYNMQSYERGRSPITGRYVSRDGAADNNNFNGTHTGYSSRRYYGDYSGHSKREGMIETLNEMLANSQTDQERQFVQKWLNRIETNY